MKWPNTFPAHVQAYGSVCNRWSLTLLDDCLNNHSWSDYQEKDLGFNIYKALKMTLYSQIYPISHLKYRGQATARN